MANKDTYNQVFIDSFGIEADALGAALEYNSIPAWDSIGHMTMIAALEEAFDIQMETDDVVEFSSYNKGIEILAKYDVTIA